MGLPTGGWIRKPTPTSNSAVVFVHGLISSSETCWGEGNSSWPKLLAEEEELKAVAIYTFSYRTSIFSGGYTLGDAVEALNEYLNLDVMPSASNLLFVCHSMGGIVVRQFLVSREATLRDKCRKIGLFLVASPSLGAKYADLFSALAKALH